MSPVILSAKSGQLSTMRKLLDRGAGTVEDRSKVKCVCDCLFACLHPCVSLPCLVC